MTSAPKRPRPLSPHLSIYPRQITSVLSILHRGTGIVLYGGSGLWALWFMAIAAGRDVYENLQDLFLHPLGLIVLLGWSFSFFYHFCNGLRHLSWDLGYGYDMPMVRKSGWLVVGASLFLTVMVWIIGFCCDKVAS